MYSSLALCEDPDCLQGEDRLHEPLTWAIMPSETINRQWSELLSCNVIFQWLMHKIKKTLQALLVLLLNITQKASIIWPKRLQFYLQMQESWASCLFDINTKCDSTCWNYGCMTHSNLLKCGVIGLQWHFRIFFFLFFLFSRYIKLRHLLDKSFEPLCLGCNRALGCPAFHLYWASACWLVELSKRLDLFLIHSIHLLGSEFSISMWSRDMRQAGAHSHLFASDDLQFMFVPFCT